MGWPDGHDITAGLPAPRDDEPESLRRDIADELADHLQCAINRELHKSSDESQAMQNALDRFGSVDRVARTLWFGWMKERIVAQRITLVICSVMALICVGSMAFAWQVSQQSRDLSAAMIAKLSALSVPTHTIEPETSDWTSVKVKLVLGETGGPPAKGCTVFVSGNPYARLHEINKTSETVGATSDSEGIADFGQIRPGQYEMGVVTPLGDQLGTMLFVPRGRQLEKEIVCPAKNLQYSEVKVEIDWPDDLRDKVLWTVCAFSRRDKFVDEIGSEGEFRATWTRNARYQRHHALVLTEKGQIIDSLSVANLAWRSFADGGDPPVFNQSSHSVSHFIASAPSLGELLVKPNRNPHFSEPLSTLRRITEDHCLTAIMIAVPQGGPSKPVSWPADKPNAGQSFVILGRHQFEHPDSVEFSLRSGLEIPTFKVESDEENHWTISLPEALLKQVRMHLARFNSDELGR